MHERSTSKCKAKKWRRRCGFACARRELVGFKASWLRRTKHEIKLLLIHAYILSHTLFLVFKQPRRRFCRSARRLHCPTMALDSLRWTASLLLAVWSLLAAAQDSDVKSIPLRTHSLQSVCHT